MELNQNNKGKGKRIRCNPTRRWTVEEEKSLIDFLLENRHLEKPTAQVYYKRFSQEKNVAIEWKLVRAKARNLRASYNKAKAWEGSTGAGSTNGDSMKGTLLKMCTFFFELDDIFGSRICETSVIVDTMAALIEEDQQGDVESELEIQVTESTHMSSSTSSMTPTTYIQSPVDTPSVTQTTPSQSHVSTSGIAQTTASQSPGCTSSPTASTSSKGIYSRTAASDIIKVQAEAMSFKRQKLEADTVARDKELAIRENEFILKQKEFVLKEMQAQNEAKFRADQIQSQEKLKILELEMQERLAMEEMKLKYKQT